MRSKKNPNKIFTTHFRFKIVFTNTRLDIDQAIRFSYRQSCSDTKTCHDPRTQRYTYLLRATSHGGRMRDSGLPAPAVTHNGRWTHSTQAGDGPVLLMSTLVVTK